MAQLTRLDLAQVEVFLRGLYRHRRVEPLAWYVLIELPALVGASQITWNVVAPGIGGADVMAWPAEEQHEQYEAALARHIGDHPLARHYLATGDPTARKISDFLSAQAFHNTALYDELYRHLRYEDQFAMNLSRPGPQWTAVALARDRRGFTERDRQLLNLLRPHLAQAQRHARALARLAQAVDVHRARPAGSRIVLEADDRIGRYPQRAQDWIGRYFETLPNAPRRLPEPVQCWLEETRAARASAALGALGSPLKVRRRARELILRLVDDGEAGGPELLLEERTSPQAAARLDLRLTPRERQVLLEVEKGKLNEAVAATLGIRTGTVKKHLEHIFDKLGVETRTAAVARLHEARDARS